MNYPSLHQAVIDIFIVNPNNQMDAAHAVSVIENLIRLLDSDEAETDVGLIIDTSINHFHEETLRSCPSLLSCKMSLVAHTQVVFDVAFSPDGSFLVSGGKDKRLLLWPINRETPKPIEIETTQADHPFSGRQPRQWTNLQQWLFF